MFTSLQTFEYIVINAVILNIINLLTSKHIFFLYIIDNIKMLTD